MAGEQDISITESSESKLDVITNALATLSQRTIEIEGVIARLHNDGTSRITQSRISQPQAFVPEASPMPLVRQEPMIQQRKEPRVSLLDKFDGMRATTKIRSLRQGTRSVSVYASNFKQLACDINWNEEALMSQFYWGLRDDVKDLLLSFSNPRTLNEAISQAVKCDDRLFQRRQHQCSRQHTIRHASTMLASNLNSHSKVEDMQIDAVRVKSLTSEERRRRMEEGLCLYCGKEGHQVGSCPKKQNQRIIRTRGAFVQENEDA